MLAVTVAVQVQQFVCQLEGLLYQGRTEQNALVEFFPKKIVLLQQGRTEQNAVVEFFSEWTEI